MRFPQIVQAKTQQKVHISFMLRRNPHKKDHPFKQIHPNLLKLQLEVLPVTLQLEHRIIIKRSGHLNIKERPLQRKWGQSLPHPISMVPLVVLFLLILGNLTC